MRNLLRELRSLRAEVAALRAEAAELQARQPVVINYPANPAPAGLPWPPHIPNPYPLWPITVCETKPIAPIGNYPQSVTVCSDSTPAFIPWSGNNEPPRFTGSPLHVAAGLVNKVEVWSGESSTSLVPRLGV